MKLFIIRPIGAFKFNHYLCTVAYRGSTHWGAPSGVMSQNIWGVSPPPTVGSFLIFRLENVQSGAYLRRKFRLDDMYYMGKRVTIRPIGKRVFFS